MKLEKIAKELDFSEYSPDCEEAELGRKYIPKLIALAKAAKNLNLENVPIGTYIDGMGHFYNALEELEKESTTRP